MAERLKRALEILSGMGRKPSPVTSPVSGGVAPSSGKRAGEGLCAYELETLLEIDRCGKPKASGAAVNAALESLSGSGYIEGTPLMGVWSTTGKGRVALYNWHRRTDNRNEPSRRYAPNPVAVSPSPHEKDAWHTGTNYAPNPCNETPPFLSHQPDYDKFTSPVDEPRVYDVPGKSATTRHPERDNAIRSALAAGAYVSPAEADRVANTPRAVYFGRWRREQRRAAAANQRADRLEAEVKRLKREVREAFRAGWKKEAVGPETHEKDYLDGCERADWLEWEHSRGKA